MLWAHPVLHLSPLPKPGTYSTHRRLERANERVDDDALLNPYYGKERAARPPSRVLRVDVGPFGGVFRGRGERRSRTEP